jgi:hypothetical protein
MSKILVWSLHDLQLKIIKKKLLTTFEVSYNNVKIKLNVNWDLRHVKEPSGMKKNQ